MRTWLDSARRPAAAVAIGLALLAVPAPGIRADDPPAPAPTAEDPIERARLLLRAGKPAEAAAILKPLDVSGMHSEQARRYRLYARDAALRTGDRAWLEEVNDTPDRLAFADGYAILTAWSYLKAADFESTRFYLGKVRDPKHLNEREKRRLMSIKARLEQLVGDPKAEREQIEAFVNYAGRWSSPTCMGCHENDQSKGDIPALDVRGWWVGDRYVSLLKHFGDASAVRDEAERRLEEKPDDDAARLRRAFALRALGDEPAAIAAFRTIDWVEFLDRPAPKPKDIFTFP